MNDYNDGIIPEPCLRLDFGFGQEYASVELGDGTGYVRVTEELRSAKRQRDGELEAALAENEKLRELVNDMWICVSHGSEGWDCTGCRRDPDSVCIMGICEFSQRMRELGIEVGE